MRSKKPGCEFRLSPAKDIEVALIYYYHLKNIFFLLKLRENSKHFSHSFSNAVRNKVRIFRTFFLSGLHLLIKSAIHYNLSVRAKPETRPELIFKKPPHSGRLLEFTKKVSKQF
jgi:hypothetical protein